MTELQIIETGEIVQPMTAEEASSVTTQIAVKLDAIADNYESVMPLIREAITRQAHAALGYASPGAYVSERFGKALSRLGVETRRQVVRELSEAGMSTRAIAPVVGVTHPTVINDLKSGGKDLPPDPEPKYEPSGMDELTVDREAGEVLEEPPLTQAECEALEAENPSKVTGLDGKKYDHRKPPSTPKRKPLPDAAQAAGWELRKAVERIERIVSDDRFRQNEEQVALALRGHLSYAVDTVAAVLDQLP